MKRGLLLIAGAFGMAATAANGQTSPDYREAVATQVRAAMRHPDKVSFEWGAEPVAGWMAAKGKPRVDGELGCVAVLGKDSGGGAYEDRRYVVFVFDSRTRNVAGQVFTLNQLNKALNEKIGSWFSRDPGCPSGVR